MPTITMKMPEIFAEPERRRHRWTVEQYQRMGTLGVLGPEERTELIYGEVIDKLPPEPIHSTTVDLVRLSLNKAFANLDCFLRSENPARLSGSQPEPDVEVVVGNPRLYTKRHPQPTDLLLLVEIANTSLSYDQKTKVPLYAAAGIGEYWIVNLKARTLEVYRDPQNGVYANTFTVPVTGTLSPLAAPQSVVLVADLLP